MKCNKQIDLYGGEQKAERVLRNNMLLSVIVIFSALVLTIGWDLFELYIC